MILGFSTQLNGKPTHFVEKIWKGLKENLSKELHAKHEAEMTQEELIKQYQVDSDVYPLVKAKLHTIREDKTDRWKKGMKIDFYINVRKKDMLQFAPVLPVVSIQTISMSYMCNNIIEISINGRQIHDYSKILELIQNDGFDTWEDFFNYFYPLIEKTKHNWFTAKIIHWTDLKY